MATRMNDLVPIDGGGKLAARAYLAGLSKGSSRTTMRQGTRSGRPSARRRNRSGRHPAVGEGPLRSHERTCGRHSQIATPPQRPT